MRTTIVAARVLASVLLLWTGVSIAWTVKTMFFPAPPSRSLAWWDGIPQASVLTNEVFWHHFTIPLIGAGVAVGLLLLASILDELRRRPQ